MADRLQIAPRHRRILEDLLREHLPGVEVWAYGSRVNGRGHDGSDLDLVLRGPDLQELSAGQLLDFEDAIRASNIPFLVEARDWACLPERFHREIERDYVVVSNSRASEPPDPNRPDDWKSINLGRSCTKIGSGATPRGGKDVYLTEGPYALIRSQNVFNDGFRHGGLAYISDQHALDLDSVEVLDTDVLLNITGDSVARVCQVDPNVLPARVNQHVAIIRPNPATLAPDFLRYSLVCPETQATLLSWAGSGGTRNALTKAMIEAFDVQAPEDVREQRAIAHVLGALDDKIELNRRMNATLEAMARALFKSWFVDFDPVRAKMEGRDTKLPTDIADLFPDRLVDSELRAIPKGWTVSELGDMIELAYGKALPAKARNAAGGVPVFGSNGQIGWHNEALVGTPGIVIGRKGNPGTVTLSPTEFFPIDTTFYVVPKREHHGYLYFLFFALQEQDLPSVAADSAVPGLNRNLAYMNKQLRPPTSVVECFDGYISTMYARCHQAATESRLLMSLRDTLLPKLVSGEIRVGRNEKLIRAHP